MAKATATATTDPKHVLNQLKFNRDQLEQALEHLALQKAKGEKIDLEAVRAVQQALGLNDRQLQREFDKKASVLQWRNQAGSEKEYTESFDTMLHCEDTIPPMVYEIDLQIAALENQKAELKNKLSAAKATFEKFENARKMLRDEVLLPAFIVRKHRDLMTELQNSEANRRRLDLQQRINCIDGVLRDLAPRRDDKIDEVRRERSVVDYCKTSLPEALTSHYVDDSHIDPRFRGSQVEKLTFNEHAWNRHLEQLKQERDEAKKELEVLEMKIGDEQSRIDETLNYYCSNDVLS